MIFQKENTNVNTVITNYDANSTHLGSMLFEMTEKAAKVRTLLEKKQRNEEICNLISSSNELSLLNSIKADVIKVNRESFNKFADIIETKILDLNEKNEKCININVDRSIKASNEVIKANSTKIIEEILSNITRNNELNGLNELLNNILLDHRNEIKGALSELINVINQKESRISHDICNLIKEQDKKGMSIYSSQLNIIQRQYELIIRDLRKRNMILEREVEAKQSREKKLYEQIKSMDNEAKEAIFVLEEKDLKINSLNSQIKQLNDENQELRDKNLNLLDKNQEIKLKYSNKYLSLKNKYLSLGIKFLQSTFENLIYKRLKRIFNILRYNSRLNSLDSNISEDASKTFRDSTIYNPSTKTLIKINENNLFDLLDVEKRIKEQEREQCLIDALLSMISGHNYAQLTSFTKIINKKRTDILNEAFSRLRN